jgi:Anti-sigma-K factor rskA, C-terminal
MSPDFDELVGTDLEPDERRRLRRAHDLLVAAGPLPELSPSLDRTPGVEEAEVVPFFNRRRHAALAVLAAAIALAVFGGGYLTGHEGDSAGFSTTRVIAMEATPAAPRGASASLSLGAKDDAGNWPMLVRVTNLEKLPPRGYYALWLTKKGRPVAPCGTFVAAGRTTEIRLNAPYKLTRFDGWALTLQKPQQHTPGRVLLTTV